MNAVLDIAILILMAAIILVNWHRGFFKSVMGFVSLVIAFIVSNIYYKQLANYIADKYLYSFFQENILKRFASILVSKTNDFDMSKLLRDKPTEFVTILNNYGFNTEQVSDMLSSYNEAAASSANEALAGTAQAANEYVAQTIVNPVAYGVSCFIGFVLIFAACMLVLTLVCFIIDKIFKLPVLNTLNKLLGLVLGIVIAIISAFIFTASVNFVLPFAQSADISGGKDAEDIVADTLIFKHFYELNPFSTMNLELPEDIAGLIDDAISHIDTADGIEDETHPDIIVD